MIQIEESEDMRNKTKSLFILYEYKTLVQKITILWNFHKNFNMFNII